MPLIVLPGMYLVGRGVGPRRAGAAHFRYLSFIANNAYNLMRKRCLIRLWGKVYRRESRMSLRKPAAGSGGPQGTAPQQAGATHDGRQWRNQQSLFLGSRIDVFAAGFENINCFITRCAPNQVSAVCHACMAWRVSTIEARVQVPHRIRGLTASRQWNTTPQSITLVH
jgi:hypothetical protein